MYTGLSSPLAITALDSVTGTDTAYSVTKCEAGALGETLVYTDPTGESEYYDYDKNGGVISKTDRNGSATAITYDALGRPLTETVTAAQGVPGGNITTAYAYAHDFGIDTVTVNGTTETDYSCTTTFTLSTT